MTERDRLATDLAATCGWEPGLFTEQFWRDWADRLIALGWTNPRTPEGQHRLARALPGWMTEYPKGCTEEELARDIAAAIAKGYPEDTDA